MVEKACYWPQMILHLNITKIFVIVSWLNPSRVSVFIWGEDCPGAGYLLSPGQFISIVRRWSQPSDWLSPGLCGQGLWILLVCISISQVIFTRLTDGEVAFIQLRIKSRPCAGARVKLYNQLDLQSIGSSPDLQRWLIQARQIHDPNWEFGLGTSHWHPKLLGYSHS